MTFAIYILTASWLCRQPLTQLVCMDNGWAQLCMFIKSLVKLPYGKVVLAVEAQVDQVASKNGGVICQRSPEYTAGNSCGFNTRSGLSCKKDDSHSVPQTTTALQRKGQESTTAKKLVKNSNGMSHKPKLIHFKLTGDLIDTEKRSIFKCGKKVSSCQQDPMILDGVASAFSVLPQNGSALQSFSMTMMV